MDCSLQTLIWGTPEKSGSITLLALAVLLFCLISEKFVRGLVLLGFLFF